jgi:hypothetical protein
MLALAVLTILVADAHHTTPCPRDADGRELLGLTNEIRHLMNVLIFQTHPKPDPLPDLVSLETSPPVTRLPPPLPTTLCGIDHKVRRSYQ